MRPLIDQSVLQGEQSKEQISLGSGGIHENRRPGLKQVASSAYSPTRSVSYGHRPSIGMRRSVTRWTPATCGNL